MGMGDLMCVPGSTHVCLYLIVLIIDVLREIIIALGKYSLL